jgi:beta-glucosidase
VEIPWRNRVSAIVAAYLGGQGGGSAIADILLGAFNPSAKLAESWPLSLQETPAYDSFPGGPHRVEYREGVFVGYRYYDSLRIPVAFPFGHGLSYSRFEYGRAEASQSLFDANEPLTVSISVKNTGEVAGSEIVQIYIEPAKAAVLRPMKELKAFCKVRLEAGEEKRALATLERRAFAYFDVAGDKWSVASGEYQILFGSSSADIRGRVSVYVLGDKPVHAGDSVPDFSQVKRDLPYISDLAGGPADSPTDSSGFPEGYHLNSLLGEVKSTLIGRLLYGIACRSARTMAKRADDPVIAKMLERAVSEMPLRQLATFSGGRLTFETMDVLLAFMNGHWLKGFRLLFK